MHEFRIGAVGRIAEDREPSPSFADGYRVQAIMDAAYLSASQRRWVKVE
ncbi:MAG: gfo/Idh/MocA family oxidoreductase, partial [Deinococcus sp.]|nr:gfo/Idh/MocA family oxidoreductase [Deinococcus sp.]